MAGYDGRGAKFDIDAVAGNDLSFTVTAVDSDSVAVNLSAATITATIYNKDDTALDTLTAVVGGAGSNVITLSLTDTEVDALTSPTSWALVVTRSSDARTWLAGRFNVASKDRPRTGTSGTSVTATVDTNVTVTVSVVTAAIAANVTIADAGGYYTGTTVEAALAELPGTYVSRAGIGSEAPVTDAQNSVWFSNAAQHGLVSNSIADRVATLTADAAWEGGATGSVQEPSIYFDALLDKWCMVYTGGVSTPQQGFATSDDPMGPWTKEAVPHLGGGEGGEAGGIAHTQVYVEASTVYQFYPASPTLPGGALKVVSWPLGSKPYGNLTSPATVFTPTGTASNGVANVSILKDGATYILMFEYWTGLASGWAMGYATSSSLTSGYTQQAAPLSSLQPVSNAMFGGPHLFKENGKYVLFYHACPLASALGNSNPTDIYRATADSIGNSWTPEPRPLVGRIAPNEVSQVADFDLVTHPTSGERWAAFSQGDSSTNRFRIVVLPFLRAPLEKVGDTYRPIASLVAPSDPQSIPSAIGGTLNWLAGSDTEHTTTSATFAQVNANANLCTVSYIVPRNRRVLVRASFHVTIGPATSLDVCLRRSGANITGTAQVVEYNNGSVDIARRVTLEWVVSTAGTPGTFETVALGFARRQGTGTAKITVGPESNFGPLYMSATV